MKMIIIIESEEFLENPEIDAWLGKLQNSGYRLTSARRTIVEMLAGANRALSPMDVFDRGRREVPGLGLVTVYRTLEKLEELGLIQRVHMTDGCHRYLRATHGHEHLILCSTCGCVEFFSGDDIESLTIALAQRTGFTVHDHWLQLFGVCPNCRTAG